MSRGDAGSSCDRKVEAVAPSVAWLCSIPFHSSTPWFCKRVRSVLLGIMCIFAGEVALVTLRFEEPEISWCNTCEARPQQYYAGTLTGFNMQAPQPVFVVSSFQVLI